MKRLLLFACIFLLFGVLSCNNIEETTDPGGFPAWIKNKADDLSARSGQSCEFIYVLKYEVNGRYYYNIDFAYSSCNNCNLYDEHGNRASSAVLSNPNETKIIEERAACVVPR